MDERAILTETRRRILRGDMDELRDNRLYEEKARIRNNIIHGTLPEDIDLLLDHHPDLYTEIVEEVLTEDGLEVLRDEAPELVRDLQDELCSDE